jgi:hypothetical protein
LSVASDSWRRIRRLRASPPLLAGAEVDESRTRVFQAALTQAEELWEAAAAVGPASRPLPLFYCLSQAGRAVCAAWTTDGPWEPSGGHGLTSSRQEPDVRVPSFKVRLSRQEPEHGMYSMVAAATDTTVFEGAASVAALWASLPDLPRAQELTSDELRPIFIEGTRLADEDFNPIGFLAPKVARLDYPRPAGLRRELDESDEAFQERFRAAIADYPTIATANVEMAEVAGQLGRERTVILRVPDGDGGFRSLGQFADRSPEATRGAPSERRYVVRPRIGTGDGAPPSQLMTLWALLFALSQLARYHPALWVGALNPDSSDIAVDLEHGLDSALELVPDLLVPAVSSGAMPRLIREHRAAEQENARLQEEADDAGQGADRQ